MSDERKIKIIKEKNGVNLRFLDKIQDMKM